MTLEKLIKLKLAIKRDESREKVQKRFSEYMEWYDNLEYKSIKNKIRHREVFYEYVKYLRRLK